MFHARRPSIFALALALSLASSLSATPAYAVGVTPGKATPVQREQAQSRFARGRELYNQKQYERALEEFEASHEIVASPNARLYRARCLRQLGKLVAAYSEFGRTAIEARELLREDSRYARAADSADAERRAIAPQLGFVSVTIEHAKDDTTLRVAGEEIRRSGWSEPIPAAPGTPEVSLETPGREPLKQSVQIAAGESKSLSFDADAAPAIAPPAAAVQPPPPAPPPDDDRSRRTLRTASYVSAGVAVAGFATFAIFGAMSKSIYSDLNTACKGGPCPPSRQSDIDAGKRDQTIANVGLAVGIVGAVGAIALFVVTMPKKSAEPRAALVVRPDGLAVGGAF